MQRRAVLALVFFIASSVCALSSASAESFAWPDTGPSSCTCDDHCASFGLAYCNVPSVGTLGTCSNSGPGRPCLDAGPPDQSMPTDADVGPTPDGEHASGDASMPVTDGGGCSVGGETRGSAILLLLVFIFFALRRGRAALVLCCGMLLASCATDPNTLPGNDGAVVEDVGLIPQPDTALPPKTDAGHPCLPEGLEHYSCFGGENNAPCDADEVCRMWQECIPIPCEREARCFAQVDRAHCHFYAGADSLDYRAEIAFTTTASYSTNGSTRSLVLADEETTYGAQWTLPEGMRVPIAEGDTVHVEICQGGMGINPASVLVVRDAEGKLLLAGGGGLFIVDTPCFRRLLAIGRHDLECVVRAGGLDAMSIPFQQNFAMSLTDDNGTQLVGLGERADLMLDGQALQAVVCDARYPIEWQAYDVNAPHEGLVIVPAP